MKEILETQDLDADSVKVETIEDTVKKDMEEPMDTDSAAGTDNEAGEVSEEAAKGQDAEAASDEESAVGESVEESIDDESEKESADEATEDKETTDEDAGSNDAKENGDAEPDGSLDRVWKAIRMYRRDEVSALMRDHAIDIATDEQKIEIGKGIMGLRDIKLVEQFAKEQKIFTPDMLRLDFENWNNRDFVRQVLSRCKKNFDLSDEEVCRELFEISCEVGQTEVLSFLVNKKKATDCYPMLASGTEEAFSVLKQVKPTSMDADMRVDIMFAAATTTQGQDRLEKLSSFGYDLFEKNSDEKELSDLLNERIASNTYTKNRSGDMNRIKDKSVVQYIEKKRNPVDPKAGRKKVQIKKILPFLILGLIFLCVLVYAIMYQIFS